MGRPFVNLLLDPGVQGTDGSPLNDGGITERDLNTYRHTGGSSRKQTAGGSTISDFYFSSMSYAPTVSTSQNFTFSCWVKPAVTRNYKAMVNEYKASDDSYLGDHAGVSTSCPADQWTKLSVASRTQSSYTPQLQPYVITATSVPAGDIFWTTDWRLVTSAAASATDYQEGNPDGWEFQTRPTLPGHSQAPAYDAFGTLDLVDPDDPFSQLIYTYRNGATHVSEGDFGTVKMRRSFDQGQTWWPEITLASEAGWDLRTDNTGGRVGSGRLFCMWTRWQWADEGDPTDGGIQYIYTDDNGYTWTNKLTFPGGAMDWSVPHGRTIDIDDGLLMQGFYEGDFPIGTNGTRVRIHRSSDDGDTWGDTATVLTDASKQYSEASFVHVGSGTILGLIRDDVAGSYFRQVKSTDNGDNWTDQGNTSFGPFTIPSPPELVLVDGTVYLYYMNRDALKFQVASGSAASLLSSPSNWSAATDISLAIGALTTADGGYLSIVHPWGDARAFGIGYGEGGALIPFYSPLGVSPPIVEDYFDGSGYDVDGSWSASGGETGWYGTANASQSWRLSDRSGLPSRLDHEPTGPQIVIKERPPLRHHVMIETPNGLTYRWGQDDWRPENSFRDLNYGSGQPGGFDSMSTTLARKPNVDYADLELFSNIQVFQATGEIVGEYRLDEAPKTAGDEFSISPNAVGWQAHLEDNKNCAVVFIDRAFDHWQGMSVQRQSDLATGGYEIRGDGEVSPDKTTGNPSLRLLYNQSGTTVVNYIYESWYDGGKADLATIYYDMGPTENISNMDYIQLGIWNADEGGTGQVSSDLAAGGSPFSDSGYFTPTMGTIDPRWASVAYSGAVADWTAGEDRVVPWTQLQVMGGHGLTLRGTADPTAQGFYASDVIRYAVETWAPELSVGTIDDTTFVIPQLEFRTPTTPAEMIKQVARFHIGYDWFCGPDKKFHFRERGTYGRNWLARIGPAKLESTGQTASRCVTDVLISYQDTDGGVTKTVGPVGSGADTEDASLHDSDTQNPANAAGIAVWAILDMGGVSTADAATQVGSRFLDEVNQLDHSGRAELTGWVMSDKGAPYPFSSVQAGDTISFLDAADTSPRRIVKATKAENTVSVDLDAPPEGVQALLERLGVQWTNLAAVGAGSPTEGWGPGHRPQVGV